MSATAHRSPGETYAGYTQLEALTCPNCGVLHAIPEHMIREARETGKSCYCPNGHSYSWTRQAKIDELEARLARAKDRAAREQATREQAEASARAQRAAATRARNERDKQTRRVAHGVCPCCKRSFKNLREHMEGQHPEALAEVEGGA